MDNRAIALKLVLEYLGTNDISDVHKRMEVQKAVYLAQESGVSLGYTYGWYLKGPYSPSLTRDYYSIGGIEVPVEVTLQEAAVARLNSIRQLMEIPIGSLSLAKKLELLASIHYLLKSSRLTEIKAKERIAQFKPDLVERFNDGLEALRNHGFA